MQLRCHIVFVNIVNSKKLSLLLIKPSEMKKTTKKRKTYLKFLLDLIGHL